jgi:hypothetical protein
VKFLLREGGMDMSGSGKQSAPPNLRGQSPAMADVQKDLVVADEQASQAWLARVKSEVDLWTQLGTRLMATRSPPEAMQAYQECLAQRMRMAAEDGQKMSEDCQKFAQKIAGSLSNGWVPKRS